MSKYGSQKPGHPADTEANISKELTTTTDIFLYNMYEDWKLAKNFGCDTPITRRIIKLIRRELVCRKVL